MSTHHAPKAPRIPKHLTIPYPCPETMTIVDAYAAKRGIDRQTAAEHLIAYGAIHYGRIARGGVTGHARRTPEERTARAHMMIQARRDRAAAAGTPWTDTTKPPPRPRGVGGLRPKTDPI